MVVIEIGIKIFIYFLFVRLLCKWARDNGWISK